MQSLVYVSRSLLPPGNLSELLNDIQTQSVKRNETLDITGILITTPEYFAQLLEGPKSSLDLVMASISRDARHHQLHTLWNSGKNRRRYPHWRMARFDGSNFGPIRLDTLLSACHEGKEPQACARLGRILDLISFNLSYLNDTIYVGQPASDLGS